MKILPGKMYDFLYEWYIKGYDQMTGDTETLYIIEAQLHDLADRVKYSRRDKDFLDGIYAALNVVEKNIEILERRENVIKLDEKCSLCGYDKYLIVDSYDIPTFHADSTPVPKEYDVVCARCGEHLKIATKEEL